MNRFLLLLLLLATPARADDSITALTWNSAKGTFQALTRALGWKDVPDMESGTFTANFTGPRSVSATIYYTRVGKQVTLMFASNNNATCSSGVPFTATSAIPAALRPINVSPSAACGVQDNNSALTVPGALSISSAGTISVNKDFNTGAYTASGNCGWYGPAITYTIQ